jgi:uncharacterized membrane protein
MENRKKWWKYLILFVIFSFLGSFMEYTYGFIGGVGIFYDKAIYQWFEIKILFIPYYGLSAIILFLFEQFMESKKINIIYHGFLNALIITNWEFFSGLFSLIVFKQRFWNYSNHSFNILGLISFPMFLRWIMVGYIFSLIYYFILRKIMK